MVHINTILFAAATLSLTAAAPITKRIAQTIAESTADWEQACIAAGGADKCNPISQTAFSSLLAAGGNCDQQDAADQMIDLAKTLGNDGEMIRLARIFVQQPRNSPESVQIPYCQTAPKNDELNGLFHCQFAGSDFSTFAGDQTGNVPLGVDAVNPAGSCPAKPDGPVPDGVQLNTLVTDPGAGNGGGADTNTGATTNTGNTNTNTDTTGGTADDDDEECTDDEETDDPNPQASGNTSTATGGSSGTTGSTNTGAGSASASSAAASASTPSPSSSASTPSSSPDFLRQNGLDAKALNTEFATLSASDSCTDGEQACVEGGFAQCVGGAWTVTECSGGTQCFALPLLKKEGTSISCTTQEDSDSRIADATAA